MKKFKLEVSERMLALLVLATQGMSHQEEVTELGRRRYAQASTELTRQAIQQGGFDIDAAWQEDVL